MCFTIHEYENEVSLHGWKLHAQRRNMTQLVLCEKDRVFPTPRGNRYFLQHLPDSAEVVRLPGVGHIPMLEAPEQISALIADFVDRHSDSRADPGQATG